MYGVVGVMWVYGGGDVLYGGYGYGVGGMGVM